jgi:hypothetical protein
MLKFHLIFLFYLTRIYRSGWSTQTTTKAEELKYTILLLAGALSVVGSAGLMWQVGLYAVS